MSKYFIIYAAALGVISLYWSYRRFTSMKKKVKKFPIEGRKAYSSLYYASRYSRPELKIFMNGNFGGALVIRHEKAFDRLWESIGLNREVHIPDEELADKFYFECDDQGFVSQLLSDARVKPIILDVFRRFNFIEITPTRCTFKQYPSDPLDDLGKNFITDVSYKLSEFVDLIPVNAGVGSAPLDFFKTCSGVLNFLGFSVLAIGCLFFYWAGEYTLVDEFRTWGVAAEWFWVLFLPAACLAFIVIKGFSTSSRVLMRFLISFGIGAYLVLRFGGVVYNCYLDHSPVVYHQQIVIDKYLFHNKGGISLNVDVTPWREGMRNWTFAVHPGEYGPIRPGITRYFILTKPGRLHFEWVLGQEVSRI